MNLLTSALCLVQSIQLIAGRFVPKGDNSEHELDGD